MRKTVLVTGGSHGIGRGIALSLARAGYDVFIVDRSSDDEANEVCQRIRKLGGRCGIMRCDLSEDGASERAVLQAVKVLGHLDAAVLNAGITRFGSILTTTEAQMDELFRVNYRAYLACCGAAARHMVKAGVKGSILFIASTRGIQAYPEDMLYGGFKAGVIRACKSIALDLSVHGIRVNCIAPGATCIMDDSPLSSPKDRMIPLGRMGTPQDMGSAAVFLLSEEASYITGITLPIDGGLALPGMPESLPEQAVWLNPQWKAMQLLHMEEQLREER